MRIALICRQQNIKTFAARHLKNVHKFKPIRMSEGITRIHKIFYFPEFKWRHISWQERMRWYDALYKLDNNFFIGWTAYRLSLTDPDKDIVVTDVRYAHELYRLKNELGFKVVRITVPKNPTKKIHPQMALGKDYAAGTVLLRELYGNFDDVGIDYSIYSESYQDMKKALDELVDKGRNNLL